MSKVHRGWSFAATAPALPSGELLWPSGKNSKWPSRIPGIKLASWFILIHKVEISPPLIPKGGDFTAKGFLSSCQMKRTHPKIPRFHQYVQAWEAGLRFLYTFFNAPFHLGTQFTVGTTAMENYKSNWHDLSRICLCHEFVFENLDSELLDTFNIQYLFA